MVEVTRSYTHIPIERSCSFTILSLICFATLADFRGKVVKQRKNMCRVCPIQQYGSIFFHLIFTLRTKKNKKMYHKY